MNPFPTFPCRHKKAIQKRASKPPIVANFSYGCSNPRGAAGLAQNKFSPDCYHHHRPSSPCQENYNRHPSMPLPGSCRPATNYSYPSGRTLNKLCVLVLPWLPSRAPQSKNTATHRQGGQPSIKQPEAEPHFVQPLCCPPSSASPTLVLAEMDG